MNASETNRNDSPERPLDHSPDSDHEREQQIALAMADYVDLLSSETLIDVELFCKRYPGLESDLRREIATLDEFDVLTEGSAKGNEDADGESRVERLSGHRVLSEIGSGGMGRVFLAVDERLGRKVAIKTLKAQYMNDAALRARFMHEARAMAKLNHPNIVQIFGLGESNEVPHFVMEYLEGRRPLNEVALPLLLRQKVELMHKVVLAVDFLHQHNLLHRDLKPANILVGSDLDPKLLDFGLAQQVGESKNRITISGTIVGTPDYLSPEQTRGAALDPRSDVFSLGTIFYQVLTDSLPFHGEHPIELASAIREQEPVLPRRLNTVVPRALQNICLKALEKSPQDRYKSAREMAQDLERYLAGEEVLALPTSYARLTSGRIEAHLRELDGWKFDQVISDSEYDALRKAYSRLSEPDDAWIMQARRLSVPQVTLYLGAWVLAVGAALVLLFEIPSLKGAISISLVGAATLITAFNGIRIWRTNRFRFAIAYLLAFCLLLPVTLLLGMNEFKILTSLTQGREDLELFYKLEWFRKTTNLQLWWALLASLPVYVWLRNFTRSSVFSLVFSVVAALFSLTTLLRLGMLDWIDKDRGRSFLDLIPIAIIFFLIAIGLERFGKQADSRYFYPVAVTFTFTALSGVAVFHEAYAHWLKSAAPWTRGQIEYLFIINAGIYLVLDFVFRQFHSAQMRTVAKALRFVIPGHVMTSLLLLGINASGRWHDSPDQIAMLHEARILEFLLPIVACIFVYGSIPEQMKNFFASGMVFLAIGSVRLQQDYFKDLARWPISLLVVGIVLMLVATSHSAVRGLFFRLIRRKT